LLMGEYTMEDCQITTIEKVAMRLVEAVKNLADPRFPQKDKITLREGDALEILKDLVQEKRSYDFIFLDAAKAQYMAFLPELMQLLLVGGMLVTD
ncbi:MAG TPA: O-methyltransferase, partial [Lachnospiraceae bacterium]|nr:O-methyltransferase [Lachnospiraceae bacterium]